MERVNDLIQTSIAAKSPITDLMVFPRAEFVAGPPLLDHISSVALMRLEDATVWMLVLEKAVWTEERLKAAAESLARVSMQAFTRRSIETLLRKELGIGSLSMAPPSIRGIDERRWEIEKAAFAWVRRPAAGPGGRRTPEGELARREWTARAELQHGLGTVQRDFLRLMEPDALRIATSGLRFDLRVYNYLAYCRYQRYRVQFAETFPSLLLTAVVAEPRSFGEELREFVDSGAPLIKGLAARWKVRPGVLRHLVDRDWSLAGLQWSRDARGLAVALDALHPEDLPGDDPAEWGEFNLIVATGQRLFLRPIWESAAGLEWLRICVRLSRRGDDQALARWLPRWDDLEQITRFRAALTGTLRHEIDDLATMPEAEERRATTEAVDRAVVQVADRGLREVATLFAQELGRTSKSDAARRIRAREILPALVPEDFVSADGRTRVTPLCTDRELRTHGARMRNCLRAASASSVAREARLGTVFIVGLYDVPTGKPLSTAEIRTVSAHGGTAYRLVIQQHTASANRPPSRRCIDVLEEFFGHCRTREVRAHLRQQWRMLGHFNLTDNGQPVHLPRALRNTLGDRVYESLLGSIRR